jgi:hypothetical protein
MVAGLQTVVVGKKMANKSPGIEQQVKGAVRMCLSFWFDGAE